MGVEEGDELPAKGTDNIFNTIIALYFPNPEKGRCIQVWRLSEYQAGRIRKKYLQTY
jgi:hypothetical protein